MPQKWPLFWLILYGFAFAAAHTQAPLYFSNQNQYFLHGLAAASHGDLSGDWLANTRDPTPIFSAFVAVIARTAMPELFRVFYFGWLASYAIVMVKLVEAVSNRRASPLGMAVFLAIHAAIVRWISGQWFGVDYPWYWQAGVANQYLLGPGLQPSVFGVLLLAGMAAFAHDRPWIAAFLTALAGLLHATYLLHAALLTMGYLIALSARRNWRKAGVVALIAATTVAPAVIYNLVQFAPTDSAKFAEAQRVLCNERIPHHTVISRWLDGVAALQIAWCLVGVVLLKSTRMETPVAVAGLGAVVLSTMCGWYENPTLSLLFPWRITAVLVPLATALVLDRLLGHMETAVSNVAAVILGGTCVVGSVVLQTLGGGYVQDGRDEQLMQNAREHCSTGDCVLLPVRMPPPSDGWGSRSTTFAPARGPSSFQFERFRLATGSRIYVDFKSIPYADVDVLEWRRRMALTTTWFDQCRQFELRPIVGFESPATSEWEELRSLLENEGITHVVSQKDRPLNVAWLKLRYEDEFFRLYRLRKKGAADAPPAAQGG